jgi:ribosomal protein S27AE
MNPAPVKIRPDCSWTPKGNGLFLTDYEEYFKSNKKCPKCGYPHGAEFVNYEAIEGKIFAKTYECPECHVTLRMFF